VEMLETINIAQERSTPRIAKQVGPGFVCGISRADRRRIPAPRSELSAHVSVRISTPMLKRKDLVGLFRKNSRPFASQTLRNLTQSKVTEVGAPVAIRSTALTALRPVCSRSAGARQGAPAPRTLSLTIALCYTFSILSGGGFLAEPFISRSFLSFCRLCSLSVAL
jgi:hypothetical protein